MKFGNYSPLLTLLWLSITCYVLHSALNLVFNNNFYLLILPLLYSCFFCFSLVLIIILIKIKQRNNDNVGYAFLAITTLKMAGAYALLKILFPGEPLRIEKINFFAVFAIFLAIETILTIKLVNKDY